MLKAGDKVTPVADSERVPPQCRGRVFTVAKVNPKKAKCTADDGGRGINFDHDLLVPATDENVAAGKRPTVSAVPIEHREFFTPGEIVTLSEPWKDYTDRTPMVVLKDGDRYVNVVRLGGEGGRYGRIPASGLVRRGAGWLAERMLEEATS